MTMHAVRFDTYGDVDVLRVIEVDTPEPGDGEVRVRVAAAGINPGEAAIRQGYLHSRWPAMFPSGQGSDFAGTVDAAGPGVAAWSAGDEVLGFTHDRASHAEAVVVPADHLARRPPEVPVDVAGALFVAGTTAWAAVRAVGAGAGDTVVVSGAAGGVGTIAVQLAARAGARVVGLASEDHHAWLAAHGAVPVAYGDGVADRIGDAAGGAKVDAFVDTFGSGYADLAIDMGVSPDRIDTIADWDAAARHGVKMDGNAAGGRAEVLDELVALIAGGELDVPIAAHYPLAEVGDAFRELEQRHTLGKIVLIP
jgi:NADPH:quinone reductase-like Zn-dependent oxidoreductase